MAAWTPQQQGTDPYATGRDPYGPPAFGLPQPAGRRPGTVTAAVWLTWVSCLLTLLVLGLLVLFLLVDRDTLVSELERNPSIANAGYSTDQLVGSLWVVAAIGIFWALAAIALGALALHGSRAGQVGLLVSAGMAGLVGIATIVVPLLAVTTVVLLLVGPSNRWFAGRSGSGASDDSGRPPVW